MIVFTKLAIPKTAPIKRKASKSRYIFSSPGRSPGRAIVLPPGVGVGSDLGVSKKFNIKVFYVMGKALSGELSCFCDRSCLTCS